MDLEKFDLLWNGMDAMMMSWISRKALERGLMLVLMRSGMYAMKMSPISGNAVEKGLLTLPTRRKDGKSDRSVQLVDSSRTCTVSLSCMALLGAAWLLSAL